MSPTSHNRGEHRETEPPPPRRWLPTKLGAARWRSGRRAIARRIDAVGRGLSSGERELVEATADAFFPRSSVVPLSGSDAGMVAYFERYLELCRPFERVLLHLLLRATDLSPLAFGPARRSFTFLDPAQRLQFLRDAFASPIYFRRVAITSLRALMTMGYLAHEEVARQLGIVVDQDPFGMDSSAGTQETA